MILLLYKEIIHLMIWVVLRLIYIPGNPSLVTEKTKQKQKHFCSPFSLDIPRGESTCLILTIIYDNIVTMLELKKINNKDCIIP